MSDNWKKTSNLLYSRLPDFLREDHDKFVRFLKLHYQTLDNNENKYIANLLENRDIDRSEERFIDMFHNEYAVRLPKNLLTNRRLLIKLIKQLYRAKGTEQATRFLFRILFDEEIEFYYPGRDLLRPSSSKWVVDKSLILSPISFDISNYIGKQVLGYISGSRTRVENIISYIGPDSNLVYELFYTKATGDFIADEVIVLSDDHDIEVGQYKNTRTSQGRYVSQDGHPSSFKKVQDSYYYQEYSYVIKSGQPLVNYINILENLTHPAGTRVFGEFSYTTVFDTVIPQIEFVQNFISANDYVKNIYMISINSIASISYVPESKTYIYGSPITGTVRVSNSDAIYPIRNRLISDFANWTISDFTNGRGVIGTGTSFANTVNIDDRIQIKDTANSAISYNEVAAIDSNTTLKLRFPYAYSSLANGTIHTSLT